MMKNASPDGLLLHQEALLLALNDEEGTPEFGVSYGFAMAGAILAELFLNNRATLIQPKKNKLLNLVSATPLGDPVLDDALARIATARRRATPGTWVSKLGCSGKLKHAVAAGLVDRGILHADEGKILLIFKRKIYPERDPGPERRLVARLRNAIFGESRDVDPRTVILLSLAHSTGLLKTVFDKKRLKERKDRIDDLISGEFAGKAAQEAIRAATAAAMAAITAATTVTVITS
jgi:hypothetical protein